MTMLLLMGAGAWELVYYERHPRQDKLFGTFITVTLGLLFTEDEFDVQLNVGWVVSAPEVSVDLFHCICVSYNSKEIKKYFAS